MLVAMHCNAAQSKGFLIKLNDLFIPSFLVYESKQQCLCRRLRNRISNKSGVKDIQIYPATMFCDKVEIM